MKAKDKAPDKSSKRIRPWLYPVALLINVLFFLCIGKVYSDYTRDYSQKLFDENISSVNNLNLASANASDTYITAMNTKIADLKSYIERHGMSVDEAIRYLDESNLNPDRQFQLVLSGSYGPSGELSFGDYTGISVRKEMQHDGSMKAIISEIAYGSGYYDIFNAFSNVNDEAENGLCYVAEFTDPDTKHKCFAVYRHIIISDGHGQKKLYTLLQLSNTQTALNAYNMREQFTDQSSVLIDREGDYIIKGSDFRNANFFDYIVNYNNLSLDWREKLLETTLSACEGGESAVDLFYSNHKGEECVFSLAETGNGWYCVTCVPLASFTKSADTVDYSLIILLLFAGLFAFDGIAIFFVGKAMSYNIALAEQAREEANSANKAKSRFLSSMSHELRTPLNAIIGFAELSKDSIDDKVALMDYIKKIGIASKLLLQLISDILDVSAIESNKLKLTRAEFDIGQLLSSLSVIYYDQCAKKDIEFSTVLSGIRVETLIGDSVRVNQMLLNYLSNAVKYTPTGGKITLRAEQLERSEDSVLLRFEVADTGCGISDELKTRLFQPFERASGEISRKFGGSGLGLSIVKNLTKLMGGSCGMESTEGIGSCFWVELPFEIPKNAQQRSFSPLKNLNIVVACGNDSEREYVGQILAGFGAKYTLTDKASEALSQMKCHINGEQPFDICMLDWNMSDQSAPVAVEGIRGELLEKAPHIMILAYDVSSAKLLCANADSIFSKPIFRSTLYNALIDLSGGNTLNIAESNEHIDMSGKRVLLVEDNKMNIELAKLQLSKVGLEVDTAVNGQLGYERFMASESGYYDVILMDVQMPVMNGYEATAAIRAGGHPQSQTIPILAMTADAFAEDVRKAHAAGMNEHLSKPISPKVLYSTLEKYLH